MSYKNTSIDLMLRFVRKTNLSNATSVKNLYSTSDYKGKRYLWTDAFAVHNFLHLFKITSQNVYLYYTRNLISDTHYILGQFSSKDSREGTISGLSMGLFHLHPTIGGLRIGKDLADNENMEDENKSEWDRDGQYFHYLSRWISALVMCAEETTDNKFLCFAFDLAKYVHKRFVYRNSSGALKMYWKMSADLSSPLVESMGHHDALDGLISYVDLQRSIDSFGGIPIIKDILQSQYADKFKHVYETNNFCAEIQDYIEMTKNCDFGTMDDLGLGCLCLSIRKLIDILHKVENDKFRTALEAFTAYLREIVITITDSALDCLRKYNPDKHKSASKSLAFRELGLAIGLLHAAKTTKLVYELIAKSTKYSIFSSLPDKLKEMQGFVKTIAEPILKFWSETRNQSNTSWLDNEDINVVMLATACIAMIEHNQNFCL